MGCHHQLNFPHSDTIKFFVFWNPEYHLTYAMCGKTHKVLICKETAHSSSQPFEDAVIIV